MTAAVDPRKLADTVREALGSRPRRRLIRPPGDDAEARMAEWVARKNALAALDALVAQAEQLPPDQDIAPEVWARSNRIIRDRAARTEAAEALAEQLQQERDAARLVPPLIRQTLEKALRLDMTQSPVTHSELRAAIDLLPESPSFYSSVAGMEQLASAEAALRAAQARAEKLEEALRWERDAHPISHGDACECPVCAVLAASPQAGEHQTQETA